MLVFISDLHLSDESTARNVSPDAFDLLGAGIISTARNRGAREVNLVLLGDTFDLVRSDYWLRTTPDSKSVPADQRPWGGILDPRTGMNASTDSCEQQFSAILNDIIQTQAAMSLVRMIARVAGECPEVKVTCVIGNHDRCLWNFSSLRTRIQAAIPQLSEFVAKVESAEYEVLARHGHEWDDNCHGWHLRNKVLVPSEKVDRFSPEAYQVMAIGEVITAELMGGLVHHVSAGGGSPDLVDQLKDVNNLRPILDVFEWLEWFSHDQKDRDQTLLLQGLEEALGGVLQSSVARAWDHLKNDLVVSGDLVDRLQLARSVLAETSYKSFKSRINAFRTIQSIIHKLGGIFGSGEHDLLVEGARAERVFAGRDLSTGIQRVIYGHTHIARRDYFAGDQTGRNRMYVNTGTYLPLISRADDRRSFTQSTQLSVVYVYRADEDLPGKERGTTSIDVWNAIRNRVYV